MGYYIDYAVVSDKGVARPVNQDNFWCMGAFLNSDNDGLAEPITGAVDVKGFPAFAVFDGMGGEQQGEVAAYIAANSFNTIYNNPAKHDVKQFLLTACADMNRATYVYAKENNLRSSGSTAAMLVFDKKDIYICNVGDSRIYQFSDNKLTQISRDHIGNVAIGKPPLTQNLGIPETEFVLQPYVAKGDYNNRDKYLICTDGLTDMVSEDEIAEIIAENGNITGNAEMLLKKALEAGGRDNITLILCEIRKQGLNIFS